MPKTLAAPRSLRTLLAGAIDYAGLFPPAKLEMPEAVANYAAYRDDPDAAWALGRFVVPAARLEELEREAARHLACVLPGAEPWRLSALAGPDVAADADRIARFARRFAAAGVGSVVVDAAEVRAATAGDVERAAGPLAALGLAVYVELPLGGDAPGLDALLAAVRRAGARAKVRTGGVTADAFPDPADLVRFVDACLRAGVPFKATAGLHHPLRAEYRLTYEPGAPTGTMFGFLNVFLAAALLRAGASLPEAESMLTERDPGALRFDDDGVEWRGIRLTTDALRAARDAGAAVAFGSCSFREPVDDLKALGLL